MYVLTNNGATFRVFQDSRQGGRTYMEDVSCLKSYKSDNGEHDFIYLAIFDGHGGSQAAQFAKEHLLDELKSIKGFWTQDKEQIAKAIREAFISTHKLMWKDVVSWPKTLSGLPSTAGTTASVVLIKGGHLYVAHVGDSSIVLAEKKSCKNLHANCVTVDHKPDSPKELKRIEESGGQVQVKAGVPRVVWHRPKPHHKGPVRRSTQLVAIPFLAVARALGDLWSYNSEQDIFIVSPEPDIAVYKVDYKKQKFIIIASDGLWNMVKPQEAVNYVEELSIENFDDSKNNPAKKLVQWALNRWAYKNLRADNTSVILVTVDQESENDINLSCANSSVSCASTIKLSDADVFTDLDVNVRGNIKIITDENNTGRPALTRDQLCQHYLKHGKPSNSKFTRRIAQRIHTPDSAQARCFPERWHSIHINHSKKYRSHLFWDGSSSSTASHDKIIIPTKYKGVDGMASISAVNCQIISDKSLESKSKINDDQISNQDVEDTHTDFDHKEPFCLDDAPGKISMSIPQENELPELNKIIIPSKYKTLNSKCALNGTLTIKNHMSEVGDNNPARFSALQGADGTVNKRKASSVDADRIPVKKSKQSIANAQNTEPLTVNHIPEPDVITLGKSGIDEPILLDNAKYSGRSPLKLNTYHKGLTTTAIISPIWPNSLENEVDSSIGNGLCSAFPLSGNQDHCSMIHKRFSGTTQNGLQFAKKSSGAKSQEVRVTAKRLYFRSRRIKLGNMRHRTRFQVRTRFIRKY